jgi:hypothetical protein
MARAGIVVRKVGPHSLVSAGGSVPSGSVSTLQTVSRCAVDRRYKRVARRASVRLRARQAIAAVEKVAVELTARPHDSPGFPESCFNLLFS